MTRTNKIVMAVGLAVTIAGLPSIGDAASRRTVSCPAYACPGGWDPYCGSINTAQDICRAVGCTGDLNYAYCSSFAPCGPETLGAICNEV